MEIRQPKNIVGVDYSNPITRSIKGLFARYGPNKTIDFVHQKPPKAEDAGTRGRGNEILSEYTSQKTEFNFMDDYTLTGGPMTIVTICDVDALSNFSCLMSCVKTVTTDGWEFRVGRNATDSNILLHRANTGFRSRHTGSNRITAGTRDNFIGVVTDDDQIENGATAYVNGSSISMSSSAGSGTGSMGASDGELYIGNRADGFAYLDGAAKFAAIWSRGLSPIEMDSLYRNPWQLLKTSATKRLPRKLYGLVDQSAPPAAGTPRSFIPAVIG